MTNFEKIKSMLIDEMTEYLCKGSFGCGRCTGKTDMGFCYMEKERIRSWLKSEAKEATE